jgi:hypothetical protein
MRRGTAHCALQVAGASPLDELQALAQRPVTLQDLQAHLVEAGEGLGRLVARVPIGGGGGGGRACWALLGRVLVPEQPGA